MLIRFIHLITKKNVKINSKILQNKHKNSMVKKKHIKKLHNNVKNKQQEQCNINYNVL